MEIDNNTNMPSPSAVPSHESKTTTTTQIIEVATKLIAISVAAGLSLSIIFDYGFYYALDISIQELPININDHIRSCLLWLPLTLGSACVYMVFELRSIKLNKKTEENVEVSTLVQAIIENRHLPLPKWLKYSLGVSVLFLLFAVYVKLFVSELLFALIIPLPMAIVYLSLHWRLFMHPRICVKRYRKYRRAALVLPAIVFTFLWIGYINGKLYVSIWSKNYVISTKDGYLKNTPVGIIRTYEKYAFVCYSTHSLAFVPLDNISVYKREYTAPDWSTVNKSSFSGLALGLKSALLPRLKNR